MAGTSWSQILPCRHCAYGRHHIGAMTRGVSDLETATNKKQLWLCHHSPVDLQSGTFRLRLLFWTARMSGMMTVAPIHRRPDHLRRAANKRVAAAVTGQYEEDKGAKADLDGTSVYDAAVVVPVTKVAMIVGVEATVVVAEVAAGRDHAESAGVAVEGYGYHQRA